MVPALGIRRPRGHPRADSDIRQQLLAEIIPVVAVDVEKDPARDAAPLDRRARREEHLAVAPVEQDRPLDVLVGGRGPPSRHRNVAVGPDRRQLDADQEREGNPAPPAPPESGLGPEPARHGQADERGGDRGPQIRFHLEYRPARGPAEHRTQALEREQVAGEPHESMAPRRRTGIRLEPHRRQEPELAPLERAAQPGAGRATALGLDPIDAGLEIPGARLARANETGQRELRGPPRGRENRGLHPSGVPVCLGGNDQVGGRLESNLTAKHRVRDRFGLDRERVADAAGRADIGMGQIRDRVAPELVHPRLQGPSAGQAVAEVDVAAGGAERRPALADRNTILELPIPNLIPGHPVGLVELADLPEWPVGHEVDRVFSVLNRRVDREPAERVDRVERDQTSAPVRLDVPAGP